LIDEPLGIFAGVVEIAIAVTVARTRYPGERRIDLPAQLAHGTEVTGPLHVLAEQDKEEQSGIDTAVIGGTLRNQAEVREYAAAQLMQDLPRLRIPISVVGM